MSAISIRNVARGAVLACFAAVTAGCTVHTYSGAAYPGTTYATRPTRYEVSFDSKRDKAAPQAQPRASNSQGDKRPAPRASTSSNKRTRFSTLSTARWTAQHSGGDARNPRTASATSETARAAKASQDTTSGSSRVASKNSSEATSSQDGTVTLVASPNVDKASSGRSFEERLTELVEQKKRELAEQKRQRDARMRRLISAAADKHN